MDLPRWLEAQAAHLASDARVQAASVVPWTDGLALRLQVDGGAVDLKLRPRDDGNTYFPLDSLAVSLDATVSLLPRWVEDAFAEVLTALAAIDDGQLALPEPERQESEPTPLDQAAAERPVAGMASPARRVEEVPLACAADQRVNARTWGLPPGELVLVLAEHLPFDRLWAGLADDLAGSVLHLAGDPLAHPRLAEVVSEARAAGVRELVLHVRPAALLRASADVLCSFDGAWVGLLHDDPVDALPQGGAEVLRGLALPLRAWTRATPANLDALPQIVATAEALDAPLTVLHWSVGDRGPGTEPAPLDALRAALSGAPDASLGDLPACTDPARPTRRVLPVELRAHEPGRVWTPICALCSLRDRCGGVDARDHEAWGMRGLEPVLG